MFNEPNAPAAKMDAADLWREEVFTDRKLGAIRRLTPVRTDGAAEPALPPAAPAPRAGSPPSSSCPNAGLGPLAPLPGPDGPGHPTANGHTINDVRSSASGGGNAKNSGRG